MLVESVTPSYYSEVITSCPSVFHSVGFNQHNQQKANSLQHLLFKNSKWRGGVIGDLHMGFFRSPFSAPYGGFTLLDGSNYEQVVQMNEVLGDYAWKEGWHTLEITYPPICYDSSIYSAMVQAALHGGWQIKYIDYNQYFNLGAYQSQDNYVTILPRSAGKNIRKAIKAGLDFRLARSSAEKELAYDVIARNRKQRGFPLHLGLEEVLSTGQMMEADFFLVSDNEGAIASAIVFKVADKIAQVIYWGNLEDAAQLRPMNYLAAQIFAHYHSKGFSLVDIGPSSKQGVPNTGLIAFKESIGCSTSLKFTLQKSFDR